MHYLLAHWESWAWSAGILAVSILLAFAARWIVFGLLKRLVQKEPTLLKASVIHHGERMARWIFPFLAIVIAAPTLPLPSAGKRAFQHAVGLLLIAAVAWLVMLVADVAMDIFGARYRTDVADNLEARKVQTQLRVLRRIIDVVVIAVAVGVMLMTFPTIHQVGASVLASAGVAGLVVGLAMKPTLSSLVAGIQIALTQPIRIDDAVVVEGEWGWIEEIQTTYVVVRIWDLRRLVVPLSYFIENPFQNWTRKSADLLGSVLLWVDYSVPVDELREELARILKSSKHWKGEVNVLQVVDANERAIQIRALMDAPGSGQAWDLRCYVREKLIQFLQQRYPHALPRIRAEIASEPAGQARPNGHVFGPPAPQRAT